MVFLGPQSDERIKGDLKVSLIDKLIAIDKGTFTHEETAEIRSKSLSRVLGEEVTVKVKGLDSALYMSIAALAVDKNGRTDYVKSYDSAALMVAEGMVEPNLKDEKLQKHFGAASPKDLAKILFKGSEITDIAGKIGELSGFDADAADEEEEVKN